MDFSSKYRCSALQLRKVYFHRSLNIIGALSSKWRSSELGLQGCRLQWSFWTKAMRFSILMPTPPTHIQKINTESKEIIVNYNLTWRGTLYSVCCFLCLNSFNSQSSSSCAELGHWILLSCLVDFAVCHGPLGYLQVDIYESRTFIGGKVGSFVDKKGNHIEMGLHVFFGCYNNLFRLLKKVKPTCSYSLTHTLVLNLQAKSAKADTNACLCISIQMLLLL